MGLQATTKPNQTPYVWPHIKIHQMRRSGAQQEPPILKISEYKAPAGNQQDALTVKKTNNS